MWAFFSFCFCHFSFSVIDIYNCITRRYIYWNATKQKNRKTSAHAIQIKEPSIRSEICFFTFHLLWRKCIDIGQNKGFLQNEFFVLAMFVSFLLAARFRCHISNHFSIIINGKPIPQIFAREDIWGALIKDHSLNCIETIWLRI